MTGLFEQLRNVPNWQWATAAALSIATFLMANIRGCAGQGDGVAVSGIVTLNGEPIAKGRVLFNPHKGTSGMSAQAYIRNGQYRVPAQMGLQQGQYSVTVYAGPEPVERDWFEKRINSQSRHEFTRPLKGPKAALNFELSEQDSK